MVTSKACSDPSSHSLDVGANEFDQVLQIFRSSDLRNGRCEVRLFPAVVVFLAEYKLEAILEIRAQARTHAVIGDAQGLDVGPGNPAEDGYRDLDVERVATRHG